MSITMQTYSSTLALPHLLSQALFLISMALQWLLLPCYTLFPSDDHTTAEAKARHSIAAQAVRDSLHVATLGELCSDSEAQCTVCLSDVKAADNVWELRNCRHVFHKGCLDVWLDHDEHLTCPLCRAPLLGELVRLPSASPPPSQPSWAVERLLYLFGDDLLFAPAS